MNNFYDHKNSKNNIYILLGKIIGLTVSILWIASMLLHAFLGEDDLTLEGFLLAMLIVLNAIGVFTAFKNLKIGSLVLIISSIILSIFAYISAGHNEALAIAVSGLPFFLAGIFFLIGWVKLNKTKEQDQSTS